MEKDSRKIDFSKIWAVIFTIVVLDAFWRRYQSDGIVGVIVVYLLVGVLFGLAISLRAFTLKNDDEYKMTKWHRVRVFFKAILVWFVAAWVKPVKDWMWS